MSTILLNRYVAVVGRTLAIFVFTADMTTLDAAELPKIMSYC